MVYIYGENNEDHNLDTNIESHKCKYNLEI